MTVPKISPLRHADLVTIEKLERATFLELFAALPAAYAATHEAKVIDRGSTAFFAMRGLPGFEFNKVLGLGIEEPVSEKQLDEAVDWLRSNCNPLSSLQIASGASPLSLQDWLARRRLEPHGNGWAVFRRGPTELTVEPAAMALTVREVSVADAVSFGAVVQGAFGLPSDFAVWSSAMATRPAIRAYLAYDRMKPVAAGLLCIKDRWGWLGLDGTLPDFRRRGAQTALLARRISDGIAMGLRGFIVETGNPAPGDDQKHPSYRNIRRAGFELAYLRTNYRLTTP
jgi:hypothetical protein